MNTKIRKIYCLEDVEPLDSILTIFLLNNYIYLKNSVAPEILADLPYDTKVDVFSAGVILYIL